MNVLIRNIERYNQKSFIHLAGVIGSCKELPEELIIDKRYVFDKNTIKDLTQNIYITKQGNGNLLIEFDEEEQDE
jgi:hypothetical protein